MDRAKLLEKKLHLDNANRIVLKLSNETVTQEALISCIKCIEPYHFKEVIEERFVNKICAYPLCSNELNNIPNQKYKISAKLNQVYELEDRKQYCSQNCYKASKYLEAQISTTPVWLRQTPDFIKNEGSIEIKLWSTCAKNSSQKSKKLIKAPEEEKCEPSIISESSQTERFDFGAFEQELKQIENNWRIKYQQNQNSDIDNNQMCKSIEINNNNTNNKLVENEMKLRDEKLRTRSELLKTKFLQSIDIHKRPSDFKVLKQIFTFRFLTDKNEINEIGHGEILFQIDANSLKQLLFIEYIIQRMRDLLSNRTKAYLLEREEKNKITVNDERQLEEYEESCDQYVAQKSAMFSDFNYSNSEIGSHPSGANLANSERNRLNENTSFEPDEIEMLSKLKDFEEIIKQSSGKKADLPENESKSEQKAVLNIEPASLPRKPMPNFVELREEAVKQQLKIKEFFSGRQIIDSKKMNNIEATIIDENEVPTDGFNQNLILKVKETNEEIVRVLPEIDSKSQSQIRRKIFYEKLIKYIEQLLKFSDFIYASIPNSLKNHVKNLIFSLNLTNENVIFSSNEWPIVAMFFLKLLNLRPSMRNKDFEQLVNQDKLIDTLLKSFQLDVSKLDSICAYMINN